MRHSISRESGTTALKAVVVVSAVVMFALLILMFGAKRETEKRATELQGSSAKLTQTIAQQENELKKLRVQVGEIERMRQDNAEIHKLRAESGELTKLRPEHQRLQREVQQLQARVLQVQSESAERLEKQRAQLGAVARFVKPADRPAIQTRTCIANLRQIDGAKQQWAIDNKLTGRDVPRPEDLYGVTRYLKNQPTCPLGGRYTIKSVAANPTCSHPGHQL
jgi:predicted RNase H-like nuclease (RuvC/YqgF family)